MKLIKPKGTLIPIGGGEDKLDNKDVLCKIVSLTEKKDPTVCLITLATTMPKDSEQEYKKAFKDIGIKSMSVINFQTRNEADSEENFEKINECDAVMFTGGDQLRLSTLLGGSELLNRIKTRYYDEPGFVVAGTSAGAAAMSNTMIISGSSTDALIKGTLELTNGLDFINSVFIDTHFTQRGRIGRLIQTVAGNPGVLGVGLGEDTGVVIHNGDDLEVIGSGLVFIVDGKNIIYTDLADIENHKPITVEGIILHVLGQGKMFSISQRQIKNRKADKELA